MKFKVMQQELPVYPQANLEKSPVRILHSGDLAEFGGKLLPRNKQFWVEVKLQDNTYGFIPGDALVFPQKRVVTNQPATSFYKTPGHEVVLATLKKGTRLDFLDPVVHNGEVWIRVKNKEGFTGYILESTAVVQKTIPTRRIAISNIILGSFFSIFLGGRVIQTLTENVIDWSLMIAISIFVLLTIYQLGIGVLQLIEASEK